MGADVNYLATIALSRLQGELAKDGRDSSKISQKMLEKSPTGKSGLVKSSDKTKGLFNCSYLIFLHKVLCVLNYRLKKKNYLNLFSDKSLLAQFCVDLTTRASEGLIDPVIGRDTEVQRIVQILCRRTKNNPILLGEPGVGKTAIAEGLALRIANRDIPIFLVVCFMPFLCYAFVDITILLVT